MDTFIVVALRRIGLGLAALTAAALLSACSHAGNPATSAPPSSAPSASAAASASPAAPPSVGATPCPSDTGWTGQNLSTAAPDPAAWLTAAQMPDAAVYRWTAQGPPVAQPFAQDVWNALYGVDVADYLAWQLQIYQGSDAPSQTIFLYASATEAHCQYLSAVAEAAGTQARFRGIQVQFGIPADAVSTEIVSGADDSAWAASWTGPSTAAIFRGPQTDLEYMVQVGTALTFVGLDLHGLDQNIPDAAEAQVTLSEITEHLSVYASGS